MHMRMVSLDLNQECHPEHRILTVANYLSGTIILCICSAGDMSHAGTCST